MIISLCDTLGVNCHKAESGSDEIRLLRANFPAQLALTRAGSLETEDDRVSDASDVPSTTRNERGTRQECGHRPAGHHHLRRLGAGWPLLGRLRAWRTCMKNFLAIGFEFSDARAVELKSADRAAQNFTQRILANFDRSVCE